MHKAEFTPRLSASSVKRLANQRLHLGRNEVSDSLDARHSTFVRLGVNEPSAELSAFDQLPEFNRGRVVAYRDCGLSFREIGSRVGRNQTTVLQICDRWMQEGTTDRRGRSLPPQCNTSPKWSVRKMSIAWSTLDAEPDVSAANGAMKVGCVRQNGMKFSLLMSHASVCNTTMVRIESGDTVERRC
ncbi:HTH_38 domain-containing protein [Trichonephila clavipes]|nr:HTH_38 domain-containing protein [Trichonephila clavipes]